MSGYPYFLLAIGIVVIIVGALMTIVNPFPKKAKRQFSSKMSDKQIIANLNKSDPIYWPGFVIDAGVLICLVSIIWRIVLRFV